jgi:tetratricopeptide (TPR) repeat protein
VRNGRFDTTSLLGWAGLVLSVGLLLPVRDALFERFSTLTETRDNYALPPPDQSVVMSLGHRSAMADLIYAHTLVSYGLHFGEKRRFEYAGDYLETVMTLDPTFAQPYVFADTLLTLQPVPARQEDYLRARELLLRGTRALPYHQRVWFTAGQFLAYLAPTRLEDPKLAEQFRQEGARLLARACELASDNRAIPHHCLAAAGLLNQSGKREALIQMLTRTLAVNDDPAIRERALAALSRWVGERERERHARRLGAFTDAWQSDLPHVSQEKLLLLGPPHSSWRCVGLERAGAHECRTTWLGWAQSLPDQDDSRGDAPGAETSRVIRAPVE